MSIIHNLKQRFERGTIVEKLIYINIFFFFSTMLLSVFQSLYKNDANFLIDWLSLDGSINVVLTKPWTLLTYGFLHADFLHILFNLNLTKGGKKLLQLMILCSSGTLFSKLNKR